MRIYACIKHVPDTAANIRPLGGAAFDETVKFIMNPYDEYALEEALRVREREGGSEVVVVTLGRESAAATLRQALAMGADRGILIRRESCFTESLETAHLLFEAIRRDGSPDLIFTGKQSVDTEGMQIPYRLGVLFDMPVVVNAVAFSMASGRVAVEREIEGDFREAVEMAIPCIVGAAKGLNRPRCPTLPDMMKAKKKEVRVLESAELKTDHGVPAVDLIELQTVPDRDRGMILKGDPQAMAEELVRLLREERGVL